MHHPAMTPPLFTADLPGRRRAGSASAMRTSRSRRCRRTSRRGRGITSTCGSRSAAWRRSFSRGTIAQRLGTHPGNVGTAGLKDRHAVTRQWVSVPKECEPNVCEARRRRHSRAQDRPAHEQAQAGPPARQPLPHSRSATRTDEAERRIADPRPHPRARAAELLRPAAVRPRRLQPSNSGFQCLRGQGAAAHPAVPVPLRAVGGAVTALQRLPRTPAHATACSARCSTAT